MLLHLNEPQLAHVAALAFRSVVDLSCKGQHVAFQSHAEASL